MREYGEIPFQGTNYEYKVGLGVVMDADSISWDAWIRCDTFDDVVAICQAWGEARGNPAYQLDVSYIPNRVGDPDA